MAGTSSDAGFLSDSFITSVYRTVAGASSDGESSDTAGNTEQQRVIVDAVLPVLMCSAAGRGMLPQMREMLVAGVSPSVADYDKRTPLHLACAEGHLDVAEFLVSKGADLDVIDRFGRTPLAEAIKHGQGELCTMLLGKGAKLLLTQEKEASMMLNAVNNGDVQTIGLLLEAGVSPSVADYDKRTPLHLAAALGKPEIAKLLLEKGADKEAKDHFWHSPVTEASTRESEGHKAVVALLNGESADAEGDATTAAAGGDVAVGSLTPAKAQMIAESQSQPEAA